jgi:hypothetical protein
MSVEDDYYYDDPGDPLNQPILAEGVSTTETVPYDPKEEDNARYAWEVVSWIIVALTLILNLVIVGVIVVNRNANSVINKGKLMPP